VVLAEIVLGSRQSEDDQLERMAHGNFVMFEEWSHNYFGGFVMLAESVLFFLLGSILGSYLFANLFGWLIKFVTSWDSVTSMMCGACCRRLKALMGLPSGKSLAAGGRGEPSK